MQEKIEILKKLINDSNNIVFFGGAGVSTESGIPDFRSKDGLYNQKYKYSPEEILSKTFFYHNTQEFYKFYKDKLNCITYLPNITHTKLEELERKGKLKAIITQNIDGLHEKAGSKKVLELHGSIYRNYCTKCGKFYDANYIFNSPDIPTCTCGAVIKPDVVLYEEMLDENTLNEAKKAISEADLLIVAGTSLTVFPASGLIRYFKGNNLVLINKSKTDFDEYANLIIHEKLGDIFSKL